MRRKNLRHGLIAFAVIVGLLLLLTHAATPSGNALALVVLTADTLFAAVDIPQTL